MTTRPSIVVYTLPLNNPEAMDRLQAEMDSMAEVVNDYIQNLAKELDISMGCAADVYYLRTRSRWSEELEAELIRLHKVGTPPNVLSGEF